MRSQLIVSVRITALLFKAALFAAVLHVPVTAADESPLIQLGRSLFFDVNLSRERNQSCASCHNPAFAYSDPGANSVDGMASLGSDGVSVGDRNAPSLTYAGTTPELSQQREINGDVFYLGGYFLDGRAATLEQQIQGPIFDPTEMAMPDRETLAERIRENKSYLQLLSALPGTNNGLDSGSTDALLQGVAQALVAFETSPEFFAFDSRYDRALKGEYTMTPPEAIGRELFFSDLTNCSNCHLANGSQISQREVFTNFRFYNIGTPINQTLRAINGKGGEYIDPGLAANPLTNADPQQLGKYRVPSLRNVAVTAPYMHNGVFAELDTAVAFYGRHLASNTIVDYNPETGQRWQPAEVAATVDAEFLPQGQPLDQIRVQQLVAFLKTLTDQRYEYLLEQP